MLYIYLNFNWSIIVTIECQPLSRDFNQVWGCGFLTRVHGASAHDVSFWGNFPSHSACAMAQSSNIWFSGPPVFTDMETVQYFTWWSIAIIKYSSIKLMSTRGDHRGLIFSSLPHSSPLSSSSLAFLHFISICYPVLRCCIAVGKSCHSMSCLQPSHRILSLRKMFYVASHTSVLQTTGIRQKDMGFAINVFICDSHCRFFKNQCHPEVWE